MPTKGPIDYLVTKTTDLMHYLFKDSKSKGGQKKAKLAKTPYTKPTNQQINEGKKIKQTIDKMPILDTKAKIKAKKASNTLSSLHQKQR